jgi:hypothetical protein
MKAVRVAFEVSGVFLLLTLSAPALFAQTNGPIAYWKFDEGAGTTTVDSSGNNHTGTIVGAGYVTGWSNSALSFNGSNCYVFRSDALSGGTTGAGLDIGTRDWTVAAWVRTTGSGMVVTKMAFVGGSNPDGWGLSVSGNGTVGAVLHKSNVGTVNIFAGTEGWLTMGSGTTLRWCSTVAET